MTYLIYMDGNLLYNSNRAKEDKNVRILSGTLIKRRNKAGSLTFSISKDNPCYDIGRKLWSIVTLRRDGKIIFRGRVLNESIDIKGVKKITCEGDLGFLNDTILPPYPFNMSVADYISFVLNIHNNNVEQRKRIYPGIINVAGTVIYTHAQWTTTMSELMENLVGTFDGYIETRYDSDEDKCYLDYKAIVADTNEQEIAVKKNAIEFGIERNGNDIYTAIMPISKQKDGSYLNISSVNSGNVLIKNLDMVALYGTIERAVEYEGITSASELKTRGQADLARLTAEVESITVTAADLSYSGIDIDALDFSKKIRISNSLIGFSRTMVIDEQQYDLLVPWKLFLKFGNAAKKFTSSSAKTSYSQTRESSVSIADIQKVINDHSGLFQTERSGALYLHDKSSMSDSGIVIELKPDSIKVSIDGGQTWNKQYEMTT